MSLSIDEQMKILKRGTADIIPEDELRARLIKSEKTGVPLKIKYGADPTAPDLHLGHAVVFRKLRQFQDLGHQVIMIIGDFTAMIGDPTGRSATRKQLTPEEVKQNARTYAQQYSKLIDPDKTVVTFNSEWLAPLTLTDVITISAKVTVAQMIERDDFANRLAEGRPVGVHELMYPICQAYDSVALHSDVELGGTDQRFNVLLGRELQRSYGQEPQVALFVPILVGIDGIQKMSKSLGNYIGVSEPANEMFSKVMSIPDDTMKTYYELATDVPMNEVEDIQKGHPMDAKKRLAREIVTIYHSVQAAGDAQAEWIKVHSEREIPEEMPIAVIKKSDLKDGKIWLPKLMATAGLTSGTGEARRLIQQGGVSLDGEKITDPAAEIEVKSGQVLQVGRRKFARIEVE